eukprot:COSAG02_NODE_2170_length_9599_cov_5.637789_7_plen_318_part_00
MIAITTALLAALAVPALETKQHVNVWKGIEYARPPQRWAVAEMCAAVWRACTCWTMLTLYAYWYCARRRLPFNASSFHHPPSEFGSVCMQANGKVGAERCLYLNVFQPASAAVDGKLPIMFWIHGGAMKSGAGSMYNGTTMAAAHDVIVITINYRLGVAGFWGSEELEQGNGLMGGIHDQIVALKWVQQHAALFGGDPKQVTIFGESASNLHWFCVRHSMATYLYGCLPVSVPGCIRRCGGTVNLRSLCEPGCQGSLPPLDHRVWCLHWPVVPRGHEPQPCEVSSSRHDAQGTDRASGAARIHAQARCDGAIRYRWV